MRARAEEIERTTRRGSAWDAERAAVIGAGAVIGSLVTALLLR